MREYQSRTIQELAACTCDRCQRRLTPDGPGEWQERLSFEHSCGFDSVFGDGNTVSLDLCQHCVREVLGQWLRITPPADIDVFGLWRGKRIESAWDAPPSSEERPREPREPEKFAKFGPDFMAEGRGEHEQVERGKAARRFRGLKGRVRVKHSFGAPLSIGGTKTPKKRP
nr:hypothetical protein [Cupriavidus metallidurans]